jgi:hypothetical protein
MSMGEPLFAREALKRTEPEVAERVHAALDSGRYILGEAVAAFEMAAQGRFLPALAGTPAEGHSL